MYRGGGGIWVVSLLLLTDLVPMRHRPRWWAVISLGWAVGLIVGPLIGGLLAQHATWRWVFYLNFPFCGFGLGASLRLLPPQRPRGAKEAAQLYEKLGRVDWVGGAGFTIALALFLFAITSAGAQFEWDSVQIVVPLAIGFIGLVATGVWEGFYAEEPMLRRSLFNSTSAKIAYLGGFIQGIVVSQPFRLRSAPRTPTADQDGSCTARTTTSPSSSRHSNKARRSRPACASFP